MHDVDEGLKLSYLAVANADYRDFNFGLVVEIRIAFVAVKGKFIISRYLSYRHRNLGSFLWLDGEVGSAFATLKQKLKIRYFGGAYNPCPWAAIAHLVNIKVAAIGDVISLCHNLFLSFWFNSGRLTLLLPKPHSRGRQEEAKSSLGV